MALSEIACSMPMTTIPDVDISAVWLFTVWC